MSASGWHTCAMTMAMVVENLKANRQAGLGSTGIDELRWLKPVYPGDTLTCEPEILDKRAARSRPEMGSYRSRMTTKIGRACCREKLCQHVKHMWCDYSFT